MISIISYLIGVDPIEHIHVTNPRGEKLWAYLFEPSGIARYYLVVAHGFRGAKENAGKIFEFAEKINNLKIGVLALDFAGSGESEGEFSSITLSRQAEDLQTMIGYLDERYSLPIIVLGRSFGGSTVLAGGASDHRIAGFILWSTPVFLEKTFASIMQEAYISLQEGHSISMQDDAGQFELKPGFVEDFHLHDMDCYFQAIGDRPVLIIHGKNDEVVPCENAMYVNEQLTNASLVVVQGADHRFLEKIVEREDLTLNWLKQTFLA